MELSTNAQNILKEGSVKIRVVRSGMFQQMTFTVRRVTLGNVTYAELYTDRIIDISELTRIANDIGLPAESQNGKAFPKGTSATDFQGL